ncbi:MAG: hypothetical protein ACREE6_11795, partial [Limisphaerales bacterium]
MKAYINRTVAQVSKPAVSPISKSPGRAGANGSQVWKPALQHPSIFCLILLLALVPFSALAQTGLNDLNV